LYGAQEFEEREFKAIAEICDCIGEIWAWCWNEVKGQDVMMSQLDMKNKASWGATGSERR